MQAMVLIHVAAHPGVSQNELFEALDSNDSTVSRTLALLSDIGDRKSPGLDLVRMQVDTVDRRRRLVYLTPKGKRLIGDIVGDLSNVGTQVPV